MRVIWTPEALQDRCDIWAFIADDNPSAAASMDALISKAAATLAEHPKLGGAGKIQGTRELSPRAQVNLGQLSRPASREDTGSQGQSCRGIGIGCVHNYFDDRFQPILGGLSKFSIAVKKAQKIRDAVRSHVEVNRIDTLGQNHPRSYFPNRSFSSSRSLNAIPFTIHSGAGARLRKWSKY